MRRDSFFFKLKVTQNQVKNIDLRITFNYLLSFKVRNYIGEEWVSLEIDTIYINDYIYFKSNVSNRMHHIVGEAKITHIEINSKY